MTYVDFYNYLRMLSMQKLFSVTMTYLLKVNFKILLYLKWYVCTKMCFRDFDVLHRIVSMRKLYSVTLTSLKVKNLKCYTCISEPVRASGKNCTKQL